MGISDYLVQIEQLTNTNLELLKTLNEAFYTNQNHLSVNLDEGTFVIPSFISLENKINALQNNFENLVNAPTSSEAYFTFDGNSRAIEVKKYEQSPTPLVLTPQTNFYHENNQVLKDFLSPVPYLRFDLAGIPNDITNVVIRKVAAVSPTAKSRFATLVGNTAATAQVNWGDLKKVLDDLVQDTDYVLYDTTKSLPVREGQGTGSYVIREIVDEYIDDNMDQHIVLRFANDIDGVQKSLTYLLFDQTIEKRLSAGDYLVTWDGRVKFEIEELNFNTNSIKARVCFGDYTDMIPCSDSVTNLNQVNDMSKMRYFSNTTTDSLFDTNNYVKVPLEEDRYIFIAIAPLNNRMNIRAPWGDGLVVDTDRLVDPSAASGTDASFKKYYESCRNIGDILNEISKVMSNTTTSHTDTELNAFMVAKPEIEKEIVKVIHINKHLDETTTIKNIRALYSQKNSYNADLAETQNSLTVLQQQLSAIDFEDTTGIRVKTQNQIDELTKHKNEVINSLVKISDEIALTANNSLVPIENAKYRIRGFFDFVGFANALHKKGLNITEENIKGIYVQYRYRNIQQETGTAITFVKDVNNDNDTTNDRTFIFSDWNRLSTPLRPRIRTTSGGYEAEPDDSNKNVPSFNQIDIPITQGEIVDVRLKVIYDFGYPFIQMMSAWSDIAEFEFPEEFIKDVDVTTIIAENNSDIETNRFNSILTNEGVIDHVGDKILDQDVTYFHKPENISSGFYTAERRIIPLRDKLKDMDDKIIQIADEVLGDASERLQVSIDYDESSIVISPYEVGSIILKSYDSFGETPDSDTTIGNYGWSTGGIASLLINIRLTNISSHSLKIFPMFPGNGDINDLINHKFELEDFYKSYDSNSPAASDADQKSNSSVWISQLDGNGNRLFTKQKTNQIITFRTKSPYNGEYYYKYNAGPAADSGYLPALLNSNNKLTLVGLLMYPYIIKENGLNLTFEEATKYMILNSGDEVVIPVMVQYDMSNAEPGDTYKKTMSFDVRTSLYSDPLTFTFTVSTPYEVKVENKLVSSLTKRFNNKELRDRRYRSIVR